MNFAEIFAISNNVYLNRSPNKGMTYWTLLKAFASTLAHSEMSTWDHYDGACGRHADDAKTFLSNSYCWLKARLQGFGVKVEVSKELAGK